MTVSAASFLAAAARSSMLRLAALVGAAVGALVGGTAVGCATGALVGGTAVGGVTGALVGGTAVGVGAGAHAISHAATASSKNAPNVRLSIDPPNVVSTRWVAAVRGMEGAPRVRRSR